MASAAFPLRLAAPPLPLARRDGRVASFEPRRPQASPLVAAVHGRRRATGDRPAAVVRLKAWRSSIGGTQLSSSGSLGSSRLAVYKRDMAALTVQTRYQAEPERERQLERAASRPLPPFQEAERDMPELKLGLRNEVDALPPAVRDSAIAAVSDLGGRVTVGDVAAAAGLKLSEAESALRALAADAQGFLEVSDEGDVLYVLPKNFQAILNQKSLWLKFQPLIKQIQGAAEYLLRVSFGTTLLASIALVYTTIFVLLSEQDNRNQRGGYGGGYYAGPRVSYGPSFYISPLDMFWYWNPNYNRNMRAKLREKKGLNFFEAVFSFVFGDGDPNQGMEAQRWRKIGDYITKQGGVVTAEELAPYLDPPQLNPDAPDDESYMLPVLQRLDGHPEVDEEGHILYRFPSLQRTAKDRGWFGALKRRLQGRPGEEPSEELEDQRPFLLEKQWKFSEAAGSQQALAIGLGAVNLAGVLIVGGLLSLHWIKKCRDPQVAREIGSGLVGFVSRSLPFLQVYAGSFFAIPAIRWLFLQRKNEKIKARNDSRVQRAVSLINAREKAERLEIGSDRIIYSTEKEVSEQDVDAADFDRRLRESGRT
eukprot:SM000067S20331  [mRNA]  locus=s67:471470:475533:+ [translate_table: standard]